MTKDNDTILWEVITSRDASIQHAKRLLNERNESLAVLRQAEEQRKQENSKLENEVSTLRSNLNGLEELNEKLKQRGERIDKENAQLKSECQEQRTIIQRFKQEEQRNLQKAGQMQQKLKHIEFNQAKVIHELSRKVLSLGGEISRLNDLLGKKNRLIREKNQHIKSVNQEKTELVAQVEQERDHLLQELEYLCTGKAAIRQVFKKSLQKLGLFQLIYRNYKFFVPIYNFVLGDKWVPSTIEVEAQVDGVDSLVADTSKQVSMLADESTGSIPSRSDAPLKKEAIIREEGKSREDSKKLESLPGLKDADVNSQLVEAILLARSLGFEVNNELTHVHALLGFLDEVSNVLVIEPSSDFFQFLGYLVKNSATVICIGCPEFMTKEAQQYGCQVFEQNLGDWMLRTETFDLSQFDLLVCPPNLSDSHRLMLTGRLSNQTRIVYLGENL